MLEAAIITFREGMEAFLIVAIVIAYLMRTARLDLIKAVYVGAGTAFLVSVGLAVYLESIADNPVTEGLMAMASGVLVGTLTVHMIKAARTMKKSITDRIEAHAQKTNALAQLGVFGFTVLLITREGMETALMMNGALTQSDAASVVTGGLIGLGLAAAAGWLWTKKSSAINLPLFLQTSAIFLVPFSVHLFFYGLHELSESPSFPQLYAFHDATEIFAEGLVADLIRLSLLAVPLGWLAYASLKPKAKITA